MAGYDYRLISSIVTNALMEKAAREMASTPGAATAEAEIAATVSAVTLPGLRSFLNQAEGLAAIWNAPGNDIQGKIMAAAQGGQNLAGYPPAVWALWGETLVRLLAYLGTEQEITLPDGTVKTTTPKDVLLTRYVQVQE